MRPNYDKINLLCRVLYRITLKLNMKVRPPFTCKNISQLSIRKLKCVSYSLDYTFMNRYIF